MNHHKMNFVAAFSSCLIISMYLGVDAAPVQGTVDIVRVGVYENKPKVFIDENGKPTGFWVDILKPMARRENWQLQYIPCEWNQCLELLEEGQLDLMVDVAHSEERDRRFDFNQEVVLVSWSEIYGRPGISINSIIDLHQKRVAVLAGSIQQSLLIEKAEAFAVQPELVEASSFQEIFELVANGEVDAGVVNHLYGWEASSVYNLARTHILINPSRLHFVTARGENYAILAALDQQILEMKRDANSAYYQAYRRWLQPPAKFGRQQMKEILINLGIYTTIAGVVVLLVWNRLLGVEIKRRNQVEKALMKSEQRFQKMAANVPGAIFQYVLHPDGSDQVLYMSEGCYELWEVRADTVVKDAKILWDMVHSDDRESMYESVLISANNLAPWFWQWRITTPSGKLKWLQSAGQPERHDNGDIIWDTLIMDISDRKQIEIALAESEERLRLVTENMSDLVCLHAPDSSYLYVTPSSEILLGYTPEELMGKKPTDIFQSQELYQVCMEYSLSILPGISRPIIYQIRKKNGEYIWLETLTKVILDNQGEVRHLQSASRDVSDRIKAEEQLKYDALHDSLTGLPNRTHLMAQLDMALKRAQNNENLQLAILFLDLDNFKVVNDSLGHLIGDKMLSLVAKIIKNFVRDTDLLAHLGGDEFVIVLEYLEVIHEAIRVAERILESLRTSPLQIGEREVFVNSSIGIVARTNRHEKAEDLLRDADLAMYRAKHEGRGRYAIFDPLMHFHAVQQMHLENDLRKAIENNELVLYYQPIVNIKTQKIQGLEALVRWQHPERGLLSPGHFIEIAENTGLIIPIGKWLLHKACQQLEEWKNQFPSHCLKMSVNLSVKQLEGFLLEQLDEVLNSYNLNHNSLVLEITESMLVANVQKTCDLLSQIQAKGIGLSIDDFGTGYSSLSYLHQLPVNSLKIDRSFVSPENLSDRHQVIAKSIIALSKLLKLHVIAEGVETPEQFYWLKKLGCEAAQGYLFSRPVPASEITELLSQQFLCIPESKYSDEFSK
ncbi:EAL domain-containing protein [Limnospira platensis CENA597]|uniref:EAL domain-containing protein n=1 Tax=Oscillatoriales TaxID=1150 RepID=UPI00396F61BD